jgi:hypothetical protein
LNYINTRVFGLPKLKRLGSNNRVKYNLPAYIHKVTIKGNKYFKVHLKRQDKSKIKYFKSRLDAEIFVDMLRLNNYL